MSVMSLANTARATEEELWRALCSRHAEWVASRESMDRVSRDRATLETPDREYQYQQALRTETAALGRYRDAIDHYAKSLVGTDSEPLAGVQE